MPAQRRGESPSAGPVQLLHLLSLLLPLLTNADTSSPNPFIKLTLSHSPNPCAAPQERTTTDPTAHSLSLTWPQKDESWVLLMRCASFLQSRMSVYLPPASTRGAAVNRAALGSTHLHQNCVHASLPCGIITRECEFPTVTARMRVS